MNLDDKSLQQQRWRVLLLNASEEVIRTMHWQRAINMLFSGKVRSPYNFDDYYDIPISHGKTFQLPTAVVLEDYIHVPFRAIKPSRKNIFMRDGMICQYSGEKLTYSEASIDHVIPRAQGGRHDWRNVVCCSKTVNQKKGDRTPEQAGLKLLSKPKVPTQYEIACGIAKQINRPAWNRWVQI